MRRRLAARNDDDGFTLVESVVALMIAAIVFLALAGSLIAAVKSSVFGRQNQQATDFVTRAVETARELPFGSLGHLDADLVPATDSRITTCSLGKCFDPGTGVPEKLHTLAGAGISQHVQSVSRTQGNQTAYTVSTYITEISGQSAKQALRLTAVATWLTGTGKHSRTVTTVVASQQRGLPLPVYNFVATSPVTVTKAQGGEFVHAMSLTNQGAPDRWNLTLSGTGAANPWTLYLDVDQDQDYTPGVDTALTDTNGDGIIDTGRVDPSESVPILIVWDSSDTTALTSYTTKVTATSITDASAPIFVSTTQTVSNTGAPPPTTPPTQPPGGPSPAPVPSGAVDCSYSGTAPTVVVPAASGRGTAYTPNTWSLHNGSTSGPSNTLSTMSMSNLALQNAALYSYSQESNPYGGRMVKTTSATTGATAVALSDQTKYADWRIPMVKSTVAGTALLHLYVASPTGTSLGSRSLAVTLFKQTGTATPVVISYVTPTVTSTCTGFQEIYVSVPISTATAIARNDVLGIRVTNLSSADTRVAYDVSPTYAATFGIGVK